MTDILKPMTAWEDTPVLKTCCYLYENSVCQEPGSRNSHVTITGGLNGEVQVTYKGRLCFRYNYSLVYVIGAPSY